MNAPGHFSRGVCDRPDRLTRKQKVTFFDFLKGCQILSDMKGATYTITTATLVASLLLFLRLGLSGAAKPGVTTRRGNTWVHHEEEEEDRRKLLGMVLPPHVLAIRTNLLDFAIQLFPDVAPVTVDNFLNYVNKGDFDNSIFHRFLPGFVLQGGGFTIDQEGEVTEIPTNEPIVNEPGVSNTRGTIAMAKLGSDPDSATSQWFINVEDNSASLDSLSGGFTVFGRLLDMNTVIGRFAESLTAVDLRNRLGSTFRNVALVDYESFLVIQSIQGSGLVTGLVFDDDNQNGQQDDGEQGLADLVIYSDANGNQNWDDGEISTVTNGDGSFVLRLNSGSYDIRCFDNKNETRFVVAETQEVIVPIGGEVNSVNFAAREVTDAPSQSPSGAPSGAPSGSPTSFPSDRPTSQPPSYDTAISSITSSESFVTSSAADFRVASGAGTLAIMLFSCVFAFS